MWHGRRTDFSGFDLLLEVVHGDVGPNVAVQVHQNRVDAPKGIAPGGQVIVVLDLGRGAAAVKAENPFDEAVAEFNPIGGRVGPSTPWPPATGFASEAARILLQFGRRGRARVILSVGSIEIALVRTAHRSPSFHCGGISQQGYRRCAGKNKSGLSTL